MLRSEGKTAFALREGFESEGASSEHDMAAVDEASAASNSPN
jgi:hypothetical protein